jgi:excinuclease UvrABC ATPase subunit
LSTLDEVGLGYLTLGQSSTTLSGGEAQRVKLATELARQETGKTLFILDEPATGLHHEDIKRLSAILHRLVQARNTVIAVEHHPEFLLTADWIIDLGPEGGDEGGNLVAAGTPSDIMNCPESHTGRALARAATPTAPQFCPRERRPQGSHDHPDNATDPASAIELRGVATHNLRSLDVSFPKGLLTVVTGVSGSGKSSLVMGTLQAESHRRYVESLSAYARSFIHSQERPRLSGDAGLTPVIALTAAPRTANPRSTVGTFTRCHDFLRVLFSRAGTRYCPDCADSNPAQAQARALLPIGSPPICPRCGFLGTVLLQAQQFSGNHAEGACPHCQGLGVFLSCDPEQLVTHPDKPLTNGALDGTRVGRFYGEPDGQFVALLLAVGAELGFEYSRPWNELSAEARQAALFGCGERVFTAHWQFKRGKRTGAHTLTQSWSGFLRLVEDEFARKRADQRAQGFAGLMRATPCKECGGDRIGREARAVRWGGLSLGEVCRLPLHRLPGFFEGVLNPQAGQVNLQTDKNGFRANLVDVQTEKNNSQTGKIDSQTALVGSQTGKIGSQDGQRDSQTNKIDSQSGQTKAQANKINSQTCKIGSQTGKFDSQNDQVDAQAGKISYKTDRSRSQANKIGSQTDQINTQTAQFGSLADRPGRQADAAPQSAPLSARHQAVSHPLVHELLPKIKDLLLAGLGYLTLDRPLSSLSGGEFRRLQLASHLGGELSGITYLLDEPTVGLHARDTAPLITLLQRLRDLGNTLIVIEHDPEVIRAADHLIEIGPGAGMHGGRLMASGNGKTILDSSDCLTATWLRPDAPWPPPFQSPLRHPGVEIRGAHRHNLRQLDVNIPLGGLVVLTGVSGSGKSTLVEEILVPSWLEGRPVGCREFSRPRELQRLVSVDQRLPGGSEHSLVGTLTGALDVFRNLFAATPAAREAGFSATAFSPFSPAGRCPGCQGQGVKQVDLDFLAEVRLVCEECSGSRFQPEILECRVGEFSIADLLVISLEELAAAFLDNACVSRVLAPFFQVGLGHLALGRAIATLSAGERQRLRLAIALGEHCAADGEQCPADDKHRGTDGKDRAADGEHALADGKHRPADSKHWATDVTGRATHVKHRVSDNKHPTTEARKPSDGPCLFVLDEPTTGLHLADTARLLGVFADLVRHGHSLVVIEHHLDVISRADWIIDLGPGGGDEGGRLVATGTPAHLAAQLNSATREALRAHQQALSASRSQGVATFSGEG